MRGMTKPSLPARLWTIGAAVALALPAAAQISQDRDPGPLLRVRCVDEDVVRSLSAALGGDPSEVTRSVRDGEPWGLAEVRMTRDKAVWQGPFHSDLNGAWAEIHFQPQVAMKVFGEETEALRQRARTAIGALLTMQGAPPKAASEWIDSMIALPEALAGSFVRIVGDPRELAPGTRVELHLVPSAKTELMAWVRRLIPGRGAPALTLPDAAVMVRTNLASDSVKGVLGPMAAMSTDLAAGLDEDQRAEHFEMMFSFLRQFDGQSLVSFAADRWINLFGVRDAQAYAEMIADDGYLAWWRRQLEMQGKADVEIHPDAVTHRGATAMKVQVDADPGVNPLLPDGGIAVGYRGVVGSFDAEVGGPGLEDSAFHELVEALGEAQPPEALPHNGVLHARVELMRVLDMFGSAVPDTLRTRLGAEGVARVANVTLTKVGVTLQLIIELE